MYFGSDENMSDTIERLRYTTLEDQSDEHSTHGEYLKKKIKKKTWKDFWVIVKNNMMLFFHRDDGGWAGSIELTEGTTCTLIINGTNVGQIQGFSDVTLSAEIAEINKRGKDLGTLKFALKTNNGVHLFKAGSESLCLEWIRVLRKVVVSLSDAERYGLSSPLTRNTRSEKKKGQKNNKTSKKSFTYEAIDTEDSEHEVQSDQRMISRSKSLRETHNPFSRTRFSNSFRGLKTFRRYNSLQE